LLFGKFLRIRKALAIAECFFILPFPFSQKMSNLYRF